MINKIRDLPGLGIKSEKQLAKIGICTPMQLKEIGPIEAFVTLKKIEPTVSRNFLYAMVGAVEGVSWLTIAKTRKTDLILQLDAHEDIDKLIGEG